MKFTIFLLLFLVELLDASVDTNSSVDVNMTAQKLLEQQAKEAAIDAKIQEDKKPSCRFKSTDFQ